MGEPTWTEIKTVRVPERQGCVWTRALDWLTPSKLYRIEVKPRPAQVEGPVLAEGVAQAGAPPAPAAVPAGAVAPPVPAAVPPAVVAPPVPAAVPPAVVAPPVPAAVPPAVVAPPVPVAVPPAVVAPPVPAAEPPGVVAPPAPVAVAPGVLAPPAPAPVQPGADAESVIEDQTWTPLGSNQACSADGDFGGLSRREALTIPGARLGTLIGKIGGSTGDQVLDPTIVSVFPVGRFCVFKSPDETKTGPLYLSINDTPSGATQVEGFIQVVISEAL